MSKSIKLIIGSARENRVAPHIAEWIKNEAQKHEVDLEVVDLQTLNLPAFRAAVPPAYQPTQTTEGQAWAEVVTSADGFVFLTPEYNRSIPSSLKSAIDYLSTEWKDKPAVIVSYGYIDGGQSAARHLRDIFDWLKIKTVDPTVALPLSQDTFDESGAIKDANVFADQAETFAAALAQLTTADEAVAELA